MRRMHINLVTGAVAIAVALVAPPGALAQSHAWLGVTPPSGLALPPQLAVLDGGRFTAPPSAVPAGEERHTELQGERVFGYLEEIVEFSRQSRASGEMMWGRVSGLPSAVATADWVYERFREAGLSQVAVQWYDADAGTTLWWPDHWEVRVLGVEALGAGTGDVVLGSAVPARGAEITGRQLTAPLVYAGDIGSFLDVDVTGKVAVQRIRPTSGAFSQRDAIGEGAAELYRRGAVAVLNYIDQPGNMHVRDFGGCRVCFNIGGEDGAFLRAVSERATRDGKLVDGGEIRDLPSYRIAQLGVGLVPEGRQVFPNLSVRENLIATAANRGKTADPWTLAKVFDLFPRLAERVVSMGNLLSGGEQQMLAIGRALMTNPRLLVLDEATEGLAPLIRAEIWQCLSRLKAEGLSILVIDKNVANLIALADRHYLIERGRVVWSGTSRDLAAAPGVQHRYLGV